MRFNYLTKAIPLLFTIFLLIFLSISNKKEITKLKILIWNTPSLSLGTYLTISTASGFIISYLLTSNLAKSSELRLSKSIPYKIDNKIDEINESNDYNLTNSYDKTLIERDVKDPSPTINANFRVIGKIERKKQSFSDDDIQYTDTTQFDDKSYELHDEFEKNDSETDFSTDWNDESYISW